MYIVTFGGQILHGDYEFVAPYFDHVSAQAKDLIKKMLVVDPAKRLTAEVTALVFLFSPECDLTLDRCVWHKYAF